MLVGVRRRAWARSLERRTARGVPGRRVRVITCRRLLRGRRAFAPAGNRCWPRWVPVWKPPARPGPRRIRRPHRLDRRSEAERLRKRLREKLLFRLRPRRLSRIGVWERGQGRELESRARRRCLRLALVREPWRPGRLPGLQSRPRLQPLQRQPQPKPDQKVPEGFEEVWKKTIEGMKEFEKSKSTATTESAK